MLLNNSKDTINYDFSYVGARSKFASVLSINDVSISYKSTGVDIIGGMSLSINEGEMVALSGPSGLGKSTLFKAIIGDHHVKVDGKIDVLGQSLLKLSNKQKRILCHKVAYIQQSFNIIERLTVLDNVLSGAYDRISTLQVIGRKYPKHLIQEALDCLDKVSMLNKATDLCQSLSGGQKQRVAIARVMMQKAKLVLADEPIASLDPRNADIVFNHLQSLCDEGIAVCIILHQPSYINRCDREIDIRKYSKLS